MSTNPDWILDGITFAVRQKIDEAVAAELPALMDRVKAIVAKEMDGLALHLLKHYQAHVMQNEIIITVKKP